MANMRTAMVPRRSARRSFSDIPDVGAVWMKRLILAPPRLPDVTRSWGGRSFVLGFYALVVALTGVVGAVLGVVGPGDLTTVKLLGLVELQPTPVGLAIYGVVTVGLALGVPLGLVALVSRRIDE